MTGIPEWNYPAFHEASETLRAMGDEPLNPAIQDLDFARAHQDDPELIRQTYLRHDLLLLSQATRIAVLPGWENSKGATWEVSVGRMLGLPIVRYGTWEIVE
jgi:hypothetical protein